MIQNTTEKITINMSAVDLGKVDLLVEEGFYSNRTDFIRSAIRHQLDRHEDAVSASVVRREIVIGVLSHDKRELEKCRAEGKKLQIRTLGVMAIADDVSPELALATIESIKVLGIFRAPDAVKAALADRIL
jgi:Arc/MetJ-type ribon-helix-helix transcriptional regulator